MKDFVFKLKSAKDKKKSCCDLKKEDFDHNVYFYLKKMRQKREQDQRMQEL